jgi:hypothetical protein
MKELRTIQEKLLAPKGQHNSYGNYNSRSCEDILKAVKPLLKVTECTLTLQDDVVMIGNRYYIKATATLMNKDGQTMTTSALAREDEVRKGMDGSQNTGTASSYARKYALNGLFAIDNTKDADALNTSDDWSDPTAGLGAEEYFKQVILPAIEQSNTIKELEKLFQAYEGVCKDVKGYKEAFTKRKEEILKQKSK